MISTVDKRRLLDVCKHESGHLVVAKELGFTTHEISVKLWRNSGHSGGSSIEPCTPDITDIDSLVTYLKNRIMVLFAGAIAEAYDEHGKYNSNYAINEWRDGGSKDDNSKIRELTQVLRNLIYPNTNDANQVQNELTLLDDENIQNAGGIVIEKLPVINLVANTLLNKVVDYGVEFILSEDELNKLADFK